MRPPLAAVHAGYPQMSGATDPERIALYVYPGDYERRGLVRGNFGDKYEASVSLDTETQYLVGGARVVWKHRTGAMALDPEQRVTVALTDLIQTSAAVLDLESGELLETSTYYPNGARETYRAQDIAGIAPEPMGFTGKEGDATPEQPHPGSLTTKRGSLTTNRASR